MAAYLAIINLLQKMKYTNLLCAVFALVFAASAASAYDPLGLNLPNSTVRLSVTGMATDSAAMYIKLENVPEGYDVSNGVYLGWCANPDQPMYYPNYYFNTKLYSSYDTELPAKVQNENWTKINYLVNKYRQGGYSDMCLPQGVRDDEIQTMIWQYLGYSKHWGMPSMICVAKLELEVAANGTGYAPSSGDYVGVVCDNGNEFQVTFIEIPYVMAPEVAALALAVAMISPAFGYLLVKKRG